MLFSNTRSTIVCIFALISMTTAEGPYNKYHMEGAYPFEEREWDNMNGITVCANLRPEALLAGGPMSKISETIRGCEKIMEWIEPTPCTAYHLTTCDIAIQQNAKVNGREMNAAEWAKLERTALYPGAPTWKHCAQYLKANGGFTPKLTLKRVDVKRDSIVVMCYAQNSESSQEGQILQAKRTTPSEAKLSRATEGERVAQVGSHNQTIGDFVRFLGKDHLAYDATEECIKDQSPAGCGQLLTHGKGYDWHFTLAYGLSSEESFETLMGKTFEEIKQTPEFKEEVQRIKDVVTDAFNAYNGVLPLQAAELCRFENMEEFKHWDGEVSAEDPTQVRGRTYQQDTEYTECLQARLQERIQESVHPHIQDDASSQGLSEASRSASPVARPASPIGAPSRSASPVARPASPIAAPTFSGLYREALAEHRFRPQACTYPTWA